MIYGKNYVNACTLSLLHGSIMKTAKKEKTDAGENMIMSNDVCPIYRTFLGIGAPQIDHIITAVPERTN